MQIDRRFGVVVGMLLEQARLVFHGTTPDTEFYKRVRFYAAGRRYELLTNVVARLRDKARSLALPEPREAYHALYTRFGKRLSVSTLRQSALNFSQYHALGIIVLSTEEAAMVIHSLELVVHYVSNDVLTNKAKYEVEEYLLHAEAAIRRKISSGSERRLISNVEYHAYGGINVENVVSAYKYKSDDIKIIAGNSMRSE